MQSHFAIICAVLILVWHLPGKDPHQPKAFFTTELHLLCRSLILIFLMIWAKAKRRANLKEKKKNLEEEWIVLSRLNRGLIVIFGLSPARETHMISFVLKENNPSHWQSRCCCCMKGILIAKVQAHDFIAEMLQPLERFLDRKVAILKSLLTYCTQQIKSLRSLLWFLHAKEQQA